MSYEDLKARLNTMAATGWNPIGAEAKEAIEALEAQLDAANELIRAYREQSAQLNLEDLL